MAVSDDKPKRKRRARQPNQTSKKAIEKRELEQRVMDLKRSGATYARIAEIEGISSSGAHKIVKRLIAQLVEETRATTEEHRTAELDRLDALLGAIWHKAMDGNEKAVDRCLKIGAERRALLGLDAPKQIGVEGGTLTINFENL